MLEQKARRGRPKGTGIDDSDRLARLAELLRIRPELKVTTGIRAMGIEDPSVIRRIRDKFKIYQRTQSVLAEPGKVVQPQHPRSAIPAAMLPAQRN